MSGSLYLDFYLSGLFVFHFFLVYLYCFRFLKFLVTVEMSLVLVFLWFKVLMEKCEVTFLLVYLSMMACEAAVGLSLLVSWVRFEDKFNVKGDVFGCF